MFTNTVLVYIVLGELNIVYFDSVDVFPELVSFMKDTVERLGLRLVSIPPMKMREVTLAAVTTALCMHISIFIIIYYL